MDSGEKKLLLGSASERRRHILAELVPSFSTAIPDVEEIHAPDDPETTASRNALIKNTWCRERYPGHYIITADTVISFQGKCMGKPASLAEAAAFFRRFSGRSQDILTGVAFSTPHETAPAVLTVRSSVTFKVLDESAISGYFALVNPLDKAGAYDIAQSSELIISEYAGSFTNIMGLPREHVELWLRKEQLC